jgi:hypothetical protein
LPKDQGDSRHLGAGSQKSGDLIDRPLVDSRRPEMKRKKGQFKEKPAQGEEQTGENQGRSHQIRQ